MTRRLYSLVLGAAVSAALVAGCGSSSNNPGKTPAKKTTPAKTTPAKTTPATTTPAATTTPTTTTSLAQAATECQAGLDELPASLGATVKSDAAKICSDLKSGNLVQATSDAKAFCVAIVAAAPASVKAEAQTLCDAEKKAF